MYNNVRIAVSKGNDEMIKMKAAEGHELSGEHPSKWHVMPTHEVIVAVKGLGEIKAEEISDAAPRVSELVKMVVSKRIHNFVGRVVAERIKHRLEQIGALTEEDFEQARRQTKTDFLLLTAMPWFGKEGLNPVERSPKFQMGTLRFEVDFICETSSGERVAVMVKRSLERPSLLDAVAVICLARLLGVADRYMIVSTSGNAYADDLGECCELRFIY